MMYVKEGRKFPVDVRGQRSHLGDWLKTNERKEKLKHCWQSRSTEFPRWCIESSRHVWGPRVLLFPFDWTEIVSWKSSASEDLPVSMRLHFVGFCKVFVYLARRTDGWDFRSDPSRRPTKLWSESLVRRLEKSTLHEERGAQAVEVKTRLEVGKQWWLWHWWCRSGSSSSVKHK